MQNQLKSEGNVSRAIVTPQKDFQIFVYSNFQTFCINHMNILQYFPFNQNSHLWRVNT